MQPSIQLLRSFIGTNRLLLRSSVVAAAEATLARGAVQGALEAAASSAAEGQSPRSFSSLGASSSTGGHPVLTQAGSLPSTSGSGAAQLQQQRGNSGFARIAETEKGMTKFSGYYAGGFYINNVQVPGSVICSHDMYLMWRPRTIAEVTPESLAFLELLKPAPQVLVLGCGASAMPVPKAVSDYLARLGVAIEVLDSRNATGYFNVLNDDGRSVVGALLVMDPAARMPEQMPKLDPLWDRPGVIAQGGRI